MAIAYVQTAKNQATTTSLNVSLTGVVAGNTLILWVGKYGDSFAGSSVSGGGATWTKRESNLQTGYGNRQGCEIWEGYGTTGGSVTVTLTSSGSADIAIVIGEFSGLQSPAYDVSANSSSGGSGSTSPDSGATSSLAQADELVISVDSHADGNTSNVPRSGDGFTQLSDYPDGSLAATVGAAYKIVSSTSAVSGRWTLGTSANWSACVATFKATGGGGGGIFDHMYFYRQIAGLAA